MGGEHLATLEAACDTFVYRDHFEVPAVEETRVFYAREAAEKVADLNMSAYMRFVRSRAYRVAAGATTPARLMHAQEVPCMLRLRVGGLRWRTTWCGKSVAP